MDDMELFLRALDELPEDVLSAKYGGDTGRNTRRRTRRPAAGSAANDYDRTVDLHGLTRREALIRVKAVIRDAAGNRLRILIITGRGNNSTGNVAIIRNAVCRYLAGEGSKHIEDYCFAEKKNGGDGAVEIITR